MSQPASLTLVKQVLHNVHIAAQPGIDALMNKNTRGLFGYEYKVEAVGVGSIYLFDSKNYIHYLEHTSEGLVPLRRVHLF